ncbi:alpha/beta fold hydrolase [Antrihabitans sp. YC2-6]|uniref:alpha/beta fold hydrolase n=1 Tax=Antrihabitans sp. YC2-6 TaxID=2799498 RepID=UPI0018F4786B|nr:alpha/beta hydrolase [Antrihabitans sp. YC2-6]MBJ8343325.1 alpha/beta hydrolase [Antrihabitans sp. YC2-6]
MSRSAELGRVHEVALSGGTIRYRERGEGPVVVFIHGVLVNGDLWRKVVPDIAAAGLRCITPDLPFGAHEVPVPNADLTPPGAADLIAEFLEKLDLRDVTLVANDTGGGITQILMTRHPERIGRVVLTPSDSFERFFPPTIAFLPILARVPGSTRLLTDTLRVRALHRLPFVFGWLTKRPLPRDVIDGYLLPSRQSAEIRRDLRRFLRGINKRHTLAAAEKFGSFDKPVLLAWASEDKFFPLSLAERLQKALPDATLRTIDDCYTFVSEEQPEALIPLILEFVGARAK